jgi:hypothetical protein
MPSIEIAVIGLVDSLAPPPTSFSVAYEPKPQVPSSAVSIPG